jgi:hypothetical protein
VLIACGPGLSDIGLPDSAFESQYRSQADDDRRIRKKTDRGFEERGRARAHNTTSRLITYLGGDACHEGTLAIARRQVLTRSNSGNGNLRPETLGATRRERSSQSAKPTAETRFPRTGYGNLALFLAAGNHVGSPRLNGGG